MKTTFRNEVKLLDDRILDFISPIDKTYRGLGIPTLYGALSILANRSVFFIGTRASGKSRTIKSVPEVKDTFEQSWDSFTLQGLAMRVGKRANQHLVWKIDEFGTFSKYHRRLFLDVVPKIISEGEYTHITRSLTIIIQNCKLTLLIALQPILYSQLCRTENRWEAMATDRFSRFVLLNPLRSKTTDIDLNIKLDALTPAKLGNVNLKKVVSLYKHQLSMRRAELFARDYVKAMAGFLGELKATQKHADLFYNLFWVYIQPFNQLQYAKDLEKPIEIQAGMLKLFSKIGCYNNGVTKQDLADTFKVTPRNIEKYASGLIAYKLIKKVSGGGRGHHTKYRVSPKIEKFFKEYDGSL